ncbi:hypothetical protein [Amycolatopsis anabasis]|uniref:hypothetical protein n=1 Tax=Amycolatopsis anabasis TaxID=1840409 RepID=UPI00131E6E66|nr:hypothetical protein [Amycolatopsis anabasis]
MSQVSHGSNSQLSSEDTEFFDIGAFGEDVLADLADLGDEPDPLQVELLVSEVIGRWWEADDDLTAELIEFAAGDEGAAATALLAALRELAITSDQRAAAAEALAEREEPEWAASLGEVAVGECWRTTDVYGDESSLLIVFGAGEGVHGVLALIDFNEFGGWAKDVVVVESPEDVLAELRDQDAELEVVSPGDAGQLLENALVGTDQFADPDVTEEFVRFRALALARARALPDGEPLPEPEVLSPAERDEIVATFLGEAELEDTPGARACARLLVDFGCEHDPRRPLRVGPQKLAVFLDSLLESEVEVDEDAQEALPSVLLAWARWAGTRDGLPEPAVTALLEVLEECLEEFTTDETVIDAYLDGTEEFADPVELTELLDRRMFAVPSVHTVIGDEELELEPADPEQRRLLVIGDFPEYHDALADDDFDDDARTQLAVRTALVDQLWDDEPPEVWQAVGRLQEKGLERDEILDELGRVLEERLQPATGDSLEFDLDDYCRSLNDLG